MNARLPQELLDTPCRRRRPSTSIPADGHRALLLLTLLEATATAPVAHKLHDDVFEYEFTHRLHDLPLKQVQLVMHDLSVMLVMLIIAPCSNPSFSCLEQSSTRLFRLALHIFAEPNVCGSIRIRNCFTQHYTAGVWY